MQPPIKSNPSRRKKSRPLRFSATCSAGLELLVRKEIEAFGGREIESALGAVTWTGALESAYRACLHSRFASRVLIDLDEFEAPDTDAIYRHGLEMDWEAHFGVKSTLAVFCTLSNAQVTHSRFASLRLKDAIADSFRKRTGKRPDVDLNQPDIRLNLHIVGTRARLALDLSGDSLHRRGYREGVGEAPLKETLAAAIVALSGWPAMAKAETVLLDPMCGSGTLLIEAAQMYARSAPGLHRQHFGFLAWRKHDKKLWRRLLEEAHAEEEAGLNREFPQLIGIDADAKMVGIARANAQAAGFADVITFQQGQLAELQPPAAAGLLLTNPPYGERLLDQESVKYLYRCFGRIFRDRFPGWRLGVFTANPDLIDLFGLQWQARHALFNGPIKCQLLTADHQPADDQLPAPWSASDLQPLPDNPLANRLRKNCATLFPWAAQEGISCFRIYDADIPEYNLAIDLYEQWLHVQEYAAPAAIPAEKAAARFTEALAVIRGVFAVSKQRIFIKRRKRQKGQDQYQKQGGGGRLFEVREGRARFLVNFTDYLDTGLFLDHRTVRAQIGKAAAGRRFLNLFAYTGSATVHAAIGGALATTTVDTSATYLARAAANMALNGYGGPQHRLVEADCLEFLAGERAKYNLIFVDPPTFSNARHKKRTFDVQKDHHRLLQLAMNRLTDDGLLIFSNNLRSFRLDPDLERVYAVTDISIPSIPFDFRGNKRIHRCWEFRHRQQA